MINVHLLAVELTKQEGGKVSLPIGQVKEVLRLTLVTLADLPACEVGALLSRYGRKSKRRR